MGPDPDTADGAYDAYVRRVMLTTYIAWWRRRWTALARERLGEEADLRVADLTQPLPYDTEAFDDALAVLVLHDFEDRSQPLAELRRALKPAVLRARSKCRLDQRRIDYGSDGQIADAECGTSGGFVASSGTEATVET
jgi:SAM-dependent methyltransferase